MAKINAPNKQYSGISAGVTFVNGVGECSDPYLLSWFESKGYEVEERDPDDDQGDGGSEFGSMSDDELKAYAEEKGIDIGQSTSRKGILKKILEADKE